jgi:hypothetical protein
MNGRHETLKSKVKLRSQWNTTHRLMIIHGTPTYQISLIYRKRQKGYDSDLKVKGQRQNVRSNISLESFMNGRHEF